MSNPDVRVDTKLWDELRARAAKLDKCFVRVGVLESKGGSEMHNTEGGKPITLVELATIHEFGTANIPERSFIRTTLLINKAAELEEMQVKLARAIVMKGMDPLRALNILGSWAASQIKNGITSEEIGAFPLAESTIARKGSSKPLVDTGLLKNAISYEVVDHDDNESGPSRTMMPARNV